MYRTGLFSHDSNKQSQIIRIEASRELDLSTIDERLPNTVRWKCKTDIHYEARIIVYSTDAPSLIEKLFKHPHVYCVNQHVTDKGHPFYNQLPYHYILPSY